MPCLRPAAVVVFMLASPALADENALHVVVDQAKLASLPSGVASLVIGNPAVADVTLLKGGAKMVLTGRGYGETNMVALDSAGRVIDERRVYVDPPTHALVVQRGQLRESYSCDPVCMPTAILGDDSTHFSEVSGQIGAHDQLATAREGGGSIGGGSSAAPKDLGPGTEKPAMGMPPKPPG